MLLIVFYIAGFLSHDDVGTKMYPLLKIGVGPRAVALGEAYVGAAGDITASYWNPAGLSEVKDLHFFISHHEWFTDIRDECLLVGIPGLNGYFTLGAVYSSIKDVEIWDADNISQGTQNLWSGVFSLSYGRRLIENLSLGFSVKMMYEDLYEESINDFAVDCGARVILHKNLQLGGVIRNFNYTTELPSEIKIGGCYRGVTNVDLLLDVTLPTDNLFYVSFGAEYRPVPFFAIRSGWRSGPYDITNLGWFSGVTAGIGFEYNGKKIDYAYVPYGKLGVTHRFSLSGGLSFFTSLNHVIINVVDGSSKQPLRAQLDLRGVKQGNYTTDESGKINFKNVSSGWIFINTFCSGYPENFDSVYVYKEGKVTKNIFLRKVIPGIFRGLVLDAKTKKPAGAHIEYSGMAVGIISNDSISGSFVLRDLPPGYYTLTISGNNPQYLVQSCSIEIKPGKLVEREFYLMKEHGTFILVGVNFDTGKASLRPESYVILSKSAQMLLENPEVVVEVSGHTDPREISTADFPSNWALSLARAEVVRNYLIEKFNIDPERLIARGYADTQPIAPNTTEEGMAKNRRTEFKIIEK